MKHARIALFLALALAVLAAVAVLWPSSHTPTELEKATEAERKDRTQQ